MTNGTGSAADAARRRRERSEATNVTLPPPHGVFEQSKCARTTHLCAGIQLEPQTTATSAIIQRNEASGAHGIANQIRVRAAKRQLQPEVSDRLHNKNRIICSIALVLDVHANRRGTAVRNESEAHRPWVNLAGKLVVDREPIGVTRCEGQSSHFVDSDGRSQCCEIGRIAKFCRHEIPGCAEAWSHRSPDEEACARLHRERHFQDLLSRHLQDGRMHTDSYQLHVWSCTLAQRCRVESERYRYICDASGDQVCVGLCCGSRQS
mmetsp:Transcript_15437/g.46356  ORF Transcript_15437/g.46356 Transcript_15437/m.46356 type:complete len:264 (-) Transcript_15437:2136-2927(-)